MKANWKTEQRQFRTILRQFHDKVARLAEEMFETDDKGELPVYVRITDRTAWNHNVVEDDNPLDIGLSLADVAKAVAKEQHKCASA